MRNVFVILVLLIVGVSSAAASGGGVVYTDRGVLRGTIHLEADALTVGSKRMAWAGVLIVRRDDVRTVLPSPNAVWLRDGSCWRGRLTEDTGRTLTLQTPLFGTRTIRADDVRAIDFMAGLPVPPRSVEQSVLVRRQGEPVPGKLLWARRGQLSLDSLLGALTLKQSSVKRYLFADGDAASQPATDRSAVVMRLIDGSRLVGESIAATTKGLVLTRGADQFTMPLDWVVTLHRTLTDVVYLASLTPKVTGTPWIASSIEGLRLVTRGPSHGIPGQSHGDTPEVLGDSSIFSAASGRGGLGGEPPWASGASVEIQVDGVATYALPASGASGRARVLLGEVAPVEGMRGNVTLAIGVDGQVAQRIDIAPGDAPTPMKIPLDGKKHELSFAVSGSLPRWPAGVVLDAARVVFSREAQRSASGDK